MSHPVVLCLGEILFDCLSNQLGRSLEQVESWTDYPGGAPANVACALVKLGTPAGFVGCVGQDAAGDELVKLLQKIGVDTTGVQRHPSAPTRHVLVTRSESGERHFASFRGGKTTEFADTYLSAADLPESLFQTAKYLIVGTLELAYPDSRSAIARALELAQQHQVKVLVDVNWRSMFWPDPAAAPALIHPLLAQATLLKLAQEEAEALFGTTDPRTIAQRYDPPMEVLVTAGEQGCAYFLGGNAGQVPAFPVSVVDTTGAGDSFVAGILHQLCSQGIEHLTKAQVAQQIVTYASAVGALTAMKAGAIAAQPTAQEVETFLKQNAVLSG